MKYDNQLRYASSIVKQYNGDVPLSAWLREYFRVNKQMGSRDRKTVSELVYGYYRLGHIQFPSDEEKILAYAHTSENLQELSAYFLSKSDVEVEIPPEKIFPFTKHLSHDIDATAFSSSFLIQPNLFLRIRPGKRSRVLDKLSTQNIPFTLCGDDCIALANNTKLQEVIELNKEAVVQDKNSQATGEYIRLASQSISNPEVWDCCAGSGGKSIMAHDIIPGLKLTVSDIRESIIHNLEKRFEEAGITRYSSFVADVTGKGKPFPAGKYDLIVADVPCSGSGTWARTPEQMYFFREDRIGYYANLQKKIVSNVLQHLKPNGYLLYITCSVFAEENENVLQWLLQKNYPNADAQHLEVVKQSYFKGYNDKADTLFAALLTNRSA